MDNSDTRYDSAREQDILLDLIKASKKFPQGSRQHRKLSNKIIVMIQTSERLYKAKDMLGGRSSEGYTDIYGEALQRTLCEINRKLIDYDKTKSQVMVWVNNILKWRILDILKEIEKENSRKQNISTLIKGNINSSDELQETLESKELMIFISGKIEKNKEELCDIYMRRKSNINAYVVLRFLIPKAEIINFEPKNLRELANINGIEIKPVRRFYRERCLPHLKQYVIEGGWEAPEKPKNY